MIRCALIPLVLLLAVPASAMQIEASRPELCSRADAVVIAEVTSYEVVWAEGDDGGILTRVWFAPTMTLHGDAPETVELLLPRGEIDGLRFEVEDTPERPDLDKRYLLFLSNGPDGTSFIVGGEAGAIRIADPGEHKGERYIDALASVGGCDE